MSGAIFVLRPDSSLLIRESGSPRNIAQVNCGIPKSLVTWLHHNIVMPSGHNTFLFKDLPASQKYDLLSSLIVPRPIAFVSTLSVSGQPNLAPFSFFMLGGINPPSLAFCPVLDLNGQPKDSLKNVLETKEFVLNLVTADMAKGMNETSFAYPTGEDEWRVSGFSRQASQIVKPFRVSESPVQFECRLFDSISHGDGPSASVYVVGEVLIAHVAKELADESGNLLKRFEPIARLGGKEYLDTGCGKVFELARPKGHAESSLD